MKDYKYILDLGHAFIAFNFRGYTFSEGTVSLMNQISDAFQIVKFVQKMVENDIFDLSNINLIAHDFGAYVGLKLCSEIKTINKLILISPILDLERHVYDDEFVKTLHYFNRLLPGNVRGIENVDEFIEKTKKELSNKELEIKNFVKNLKIKMLKIIIGEEDKIIPLTEVNKILQYANIVPEITVVSCMDHECIEEEDVEKITQEIISFLQS